jgi:hypothetical protein
MKIWCKQTKYHSKCYYCSGANTKSGCVLDRSFHFHTWALTVCIAKYLYLAHTGRLSVRTASETTFILARRSRRYVFRIFWFISNVDAPIHELWHFGEAVAPRSKKVSEARGESPGSLLSLRSACVCTQNINDPSYLMWQPPSKRKRESHCIDGPLSYHV